MLESKFGNRESTATIDVLYRGLKWASKVLHVAIYHEVVIEIVLQEQVRYRRIQTRLSRVGARRRKWEGFAAVQTGLPVGGIFGSSGRFLAGPSGDGECLLLLWWHFHWYVQQRSKLDLEWVWNSEFVSVIEYGSVPESDD